MELKLLNQCWMYLYDLTLTDIYSADGLDIAHPIYNGLRLADRKSTLKWLEQQHSGKAAQQLWKMAVK
jgi:hypothetical protein